MKIKKTFQGELPENRIVNAKSNSQTDAYSANYLNDKLNKVVVSLEEPTTGEEVWIKRSINTLKFSDFTKEVNGITFKMKDQVLSIKGTATAYTQECYMPIKKTLEEDMTLTQYTSGKADGLVAKAAYTDNGTSYYPNLFSVELNKGAYIDQLYFIISEGAVIDAEVRFQLERGKGTHDWQPVTEKQVFVKNENGVYEELVKKNLHVGIDEPKNGENVWIRKSKNLVNLNNVRQETGQGLTVTPNASTSSINLSGTPTGPYLFHLLKRFKPKHSIKMTINGKQEQSDNIVLGYTLVETNGNVVDRENVYELDISPYNINYVDIWFKRYNNNVAMNSDVKILITYDDDITFEPYVVPEVYTKNAEGKYIGFYDEESFSKNTVIVKQTNNSTQGSWRNVKYDPGHKFLVIIIVGSNNSNVNVIPIDLIKSFDPSDPIKIIVNGTTIVQYAWSGGNIVEYIWTSGYKIEHYTY